MYKVPGWFSTFNHNAVTNWYSMSLLKVPCTLLVYRTKKVSSENLVVFIKIVALSVVKFLFLNV